MRYGGQNIVENLSLLDDFFCWKSVSMFTNCEKLLWNAQKWEIEFLNVKVPFKNYVLLEEGGKFRILWINDPKLVSPLMWREFRTKSQRTFWIAPLCIFTIFYNQHGVQFFSKFWLHFWTKPTFPRSRS